MSRFWRNAAYGWLGMAAAMTANGIARETLIRPRTGERAAGAISAATGIALIQSIAWRSFRDVRARSRADIAAVSAAWLLMTLAFEFSIGLGVDKKPVRELLENYDVRKGKLWPVVLATVVAAPFVWTRLSRPDRA